MTEQIRQILVGVSSAMSDDEGSIEVCAADRHTARQVFELAARVDAEVHLLHVVDFLDGRASRKDRGVEQLVREQLEVDLAELCREAEAAGSSATYRFAHGKPWYELLRAAEHLSADLVALSPRRQALKITDRLRYGSTSTRMIRNCNAPLWIVDGGARGVPKRVLALVDRTEISQHVIAAADRIAEAAGATRTVLHCMEYPDDVVLRRLPHAYRALKNYHTAERESARKDLTMLTGGESRGWSVLVDDEWIGRAVGRLIERDDYDMIVMASVSHLRLPDVLLGTTAERILNRAAVSAWIIRPTEAVGK